MKLHMFLYDDLAATFDAGSGPLTRIEDVRWTAAGARVSAAWDRVPSSEVLTHWLEACLPENGARLPYEERARKLKLEHGERPLLDGPVDILWGNTDAEYPGAIRFRRKGESDRDDAVDEYVCLSDEGIGNRLHEAWRTASQTRRGPECGFPERRSSLSGVRGKIGLTRASDGTWVAACGSALNTWIAKHEDSSRLAGEAGVESICQRVLGLIGIAAAQTLSRVFAGEQCVLSERSDRHFDRKSNRVLPRHQEEFCQACGWPSSLKYDLGLKAEPRWERAYDILERCSQDPKSAQERLTRILSASWALGHTDLHRRNLGFAHFPPDEKFGIEIAPMYDVSSGIGVEKAIHFQMAVGIARQNNFQKVGPVQWLEHAKTAKQDGESVLAIVSQTLAELPDALATARNCARSEDENRNQSAVDQRVEAMLAYMERRRRAWQNVLGRIRATGARGLGVDESKPHLSSNELEGQPHSKTWRAERNP